MEAALSVYLESFATTLGSREQMAIAEFADALLVRRVEGVQSLRTAIMQGGHRSTVVGHMS